VHWNPGTPTAIAASRPDVVVVSGYSSLTSQVVMRWLRRRGLPWIFWGEVPGIRSLRGLKARLRSLAMRPALQWPSAIAGIGSGAVEQYRRHARPGCPVVNIPYHTDLSMFSEATRNSQPDRVRMLYCGQLIARKGVIPLMEAFSKVAREIPNLELTLVGEGELKADLQRSLGDDIRDRIDFAGFHPVKELPAFFAAADIFVLPSLHDGWGVVVNQALAAGLPIIVSDAVGAAADLVTGGWNGEVASAGNVAVLEQAFHKLGCDGRLRRQYGENSRARSADWTPARGVDRWVDLVASVLSSSREDRAPR
jgi:glycosyltransferase involved in cell wall biosynthesis